MMVWKASRTKDGMEDFNISMLAWKASMRVWDLSMMA
jgi:hypothetical protein